MKEEFSINIGGRGGGIADIAELFREDPELQGQVFGELQQIYRAYDRANGTSLETGFLLNIILGFGDTYP